jgi:hypothetical protein
MDQYGLDKFSLVNFAVGMLWYQAGFSFVSLAIVYIPTRPDATQSPMHHSHVIKYPMPTPSGFDHRQIRSRIGLKM